MHGATSKEVNGKNPAKSQWVQEEHLTQAKIFTVTTRALAF